MPRVPKVSGSSNLKGQRVGSDRSSNRDSISTDSVYVTRTDTVTGSNLLTLTVTTMGEGTEAHLGMITMATLLGSSVVRCDAMDQVRVTSRGTSGDRCSISGRGNNIDMPPANNLVLMEIKGHADMILNLLTEIANWEGKVNHAGMIMVTMPMDLFVDRGRITEPRTTGRGLVVGWARSSVILALLSRLLP